MIKKSKIQNPMALILDLGILGSQIQGPSPVFIVSRNRNALVS